MKTPAQNEKKTEEWSYRKMEINGNQEGYIPKIIHYCHFGGEETVGRLAKACMATWQVLDSYRMIRWDESNCDIHENAFIEECYSQGKYAFVSDYFRLKALSQYGGIYLDTDVYVKKPFDDLLHYDFFAGFIYDHLIGTAVIGATAHNEIIQMALEDYRNMQECISNNYLFTGHVEKALTPLLQNGKTQRFPERNAIILSKTEFESGKIIGCPYCIHMCDGSWWRKADIHKERHNSVKLALAKTPIVHVLAIIKWIAARKQNKQFRKQQALK